MGEIGPFLPVLILAFCCVVAGIILIRRESKQSKIYIPHSEGIYENVIYDSKTMSRRSGAMAHTTTEYLSKFTIIYFQDGRTVAGNGHCEMIFPKGTRIKVYKNPFNRLKIEKHDEGIPPPPENTKIRKP